MKRSRFFCENCRREVRPTAKVCPHCGRFFEAVRCPACNFIGEASDFLHGCPNCGYAGGNDDRRTGFEQVDYGVPARQPNSGPPSWVWPLAIVILLVVFAGLVVVYLSM